MLSVSTNTIFQTNYKKNGSAPFFKGYYGNTLITPTRANKSDTVTNQTYFFRDLKTLEFIKTWLEKHFKNGTQIADFGCSNGEEAYSIAMLINDINKDQKYKITGYDISPSIIINAKEGIHRIYEEGEENFLDKDSTLKAFEPLRSLFYQFFQKKCWSSLCNTTSNPLSKVVSFKVGDIYEINNKIKLPKDTGVVVFKNAWYHVCPDFKEESLAILDKITKNINDALPENGILVTGIFERDHLVEGYNGEPRKVKNYNGTTVEAVVDSPFHKILIKNGFEPVFYEKPRYYKFYLPAVWRKR